MVLSIQIFQYLHQIPPSVCTLVLFILLAELLINPRRACAERVTVVVSCVCMYVCLSAHAILAVRTIRSITKDAIVLNVRFAAILKWRFS